MNPLRSMPLAVACTLVVCGCENSPSNNRGLDFEEIEVNFLATKEGSSWSDSDEVGLLAYCTRNELENTSMGGASVNVLYPLESAASTYLMGKSGESSVIARRGDHNFVFYAFTPFDSQQTDPEAIDVVIPDEVDYDSANPASASVWFATAKKTSVVAPVELAFRRLDLTATFAVPDNIIDMDGGTVLKSMLVRPKETDNFTGSLACSGTYDMIASELTVAGSSTSISVDFGESGLALKPGVNDISVLMSPFTVPEGGIELVFTDMDGNTVNVSVWETEYGTEFKAGDHRTASIQMSGDVEVIPCNSPVLWPVGYENGEPVFTKQNQPQWPQMNFTVSDYRGGLPHTWLSDQPQATITWNVSDSHPDDTKILLENNQFPQYNYASPCVKGIWTGDYFEFTVPVVDVKAGTEVRLTVPAYNRGGPLFWDVMWLDGKTWRSNTSLQKSVGDQYEQECTWVIPNGNTVKTWEGYVMTDSIKLNNAVRSGYLKIRLVCVDGTKVASSTTSSSSISAPNTSNPFAFVNISGNCKAISVEWE